MAAEEDWHWDLNPGAAAIPAEDHAALAEWGPCGFDESQDHIALGCSLLPRGLGTRRDFAWRKRVKGLLLGEMRRCHMVLD